MQNYDPQAIVNWIGAGTVLTFAVFAALQNLIGPLLVLFPQQWTVIQFLTKFCALTFGAKTAVPVGFTQTQVTVDAGKQGTLQTTTTEQTVAGPPVVPPAAALILVILSGLVQQGCAGTFDESSGKLAIGPRKTVDQTYCRELSSRARWEQALSIAGAGLTGATGIASWPIESKDGRLGLAIGATVLASGTALVLTLWQADAAAYIESGCAAPKERTK